MKKTKKLNKVTRLKKSKKKLSLGSILEENPQPIGQGLNLAGDLAGGLAPEGSMGGGIASGALKGAGALAAAGPIGMAAGAVIGGTVGAINSKKLKEQQEELDKTRSNAIQQSLMKYKSGGKLASKLNVLKGGGLVPVSKDAVEVQANNPAQTDSVELDQAYVDHNEIIDKENRVFSDDLKMPDGKSIASHAKRLEKMKNSKSRFKNSNSLIDSKLDKLFAHQETSKKTSLKKGGKLSYDIGGEIVPEGETPQQMRSYIDAELIKNYPGIPLEELDQHNKPIIPGQMDTEAQLAIRRGYAPTIKIERPQKQQVASLNKGGRINKRKLNNALEAGIDPQDRMRPDQVQGRTGGFTPNTDNLISNVATFAPNIVSTALQSRLKGPAASQLESTAKLKRISPTAQLAELNRQTGAVSETINKNTAQSADLISGQGSLLAKKLNAQNAVYGQVNNQNVQINNQEAFLNQGVKARNAGRVNQFLSDSVDFSNAKKRLTSENVANLSSKVLQQGREKNLMERDSLALSVLEKSYGDSGVLARVYEKDPELAARIKKLLGKSKGGKLYNKKKAK